MAAAAAVMNNMELTRGLELLNAQVADLSNRLAAAIPEMSQTICRFGEWHQDYVQCREG